MPKRMDIYRERMQFAREDLVEMFSPSNPAIKTGLYALSGIVGGAGLWAMGASGTLQAPGQDVAQLVGGLGGLALAYRHGHASPGLLRGAIIGLIIGIALATLGAAYLASLVPHLPPAIIHSLFMLIQYAAFCGALWSCFASHKGPRNAR